MASTSGSSVSAWDKLIKGTGDVLDLAVSYEKGRQVDVETTSDGNNVPDQNDIKHGNVNRANNDPLGGALSRSFGGLTIPQWGMISGGLVVGMVGLKALRVI